MLIRRLSTRFALVSILMAWLAPLPPALAQANGAEEPACPQADTPPRLKLAMFDYAGAESGDAARHFSRFQQIIRRKLAHVAEEVIETGLPLSELEDLSVFAAGQDTLASRRAVRNYANQPDILKVLRGDIAEMGDGFEITSLVFLGNRKGPLRSEELIVTMPVDRREYANTRDGHSILAAYALAVDAAQRQCPTSVVLALLSFTRNKIADVRERGSDSLDFIEEVDAAAEAMIAEVTG